MFLSVFGQRWLFDLKFTKISSEANQWGVILRRLLCAQMLCRQRNKAENTSEATRGWCSLVCNYSEYVIRPWSGMFPLPLLPPELQGCLWVRTTKAPFPPYTVWDTHSALKAEGYFSIDVLHSVYVPDILLIQWKTLSFNFPFLVFFLYATVSAFNFFLFNNQPLRSISCYIPGLQHI